MNLIQHALLEPVHAKNLTPPQAIGNSLIEISIVKPNVA